MSGMNDYVLKTTYNQAVGEINGKIDDINAQTGYDATELANKGTIAERLNSLENSGSSSGSTGGALEEYATKNYVDTETSALWDALGDLGEGETVATLIQGLVNRIKALEEKDTGDGLTEDEVKAIVNAAISAKPKYQLPYSAADLTAKLSKL